MRIIKLSPLDEDMRTRSDVVRFFSERLPGVELSRRFGLTDAKSEMQGIQKGTLLVVAYQTEVMFLARADSGVIQPGRGVRYPHFRIRTDSIRRVRGSLQAFERALKRSGRWGKQIVHTQAWPSLPDELEEFTLGFFRTPNRGPLQPVDPPVTVDDLIAFVRRHPQPLATVGHRARFKAWPAGSGVVIHPYGSTPRRVTGKALERYLWIFNRTGSYRTTDYRDNFRHASYVLALVREVQRPRLAPARPLSAKGQALLDVLVAAIRTGKIKKDQPATFMPYSAALVALGKAPWPRPGSRLRWAGLDDLNEWTKSAEVPLITGLVVSKASWRPSSGFPASHGQDPNGNWEPWWRKQTRRAIAFDWSPYSTNGAPKAVDVPEGGVPKRETAEISRIVRNTAIIRELKALYNGTCQCCGHTLVLPSGKPYVEGHHLQPLGKPHGGPDRKSNVICVCPNCHVLLDFAAVRLELGRLKVLKHDIGEEFVEYHNGRLLQSMAGSV